MYVYFQISVVVFVARKSSSGVYNNNNNNDSNDIVQKGFDRLKQKQKKYAASFVPRLKSVRNSFLRSGQNYFEKYTCT